MAFSEVREYMPGDDVRDIDWNVTARYARPFIKTFEEERELCVMLLVDVSGSQTFGTLEETKRELTAEIAATLAFSAIQNNDKIGVLFFSDKIEKYIPANKGRKHILHIIRELLQFNSESRKTDLSVPLNFMMQVIKKRSTAFLISDYLSPCKKYSKALNIAANKHDLVALHVYDRHEAILPPMGLVQFNDAETDRKYWVDTNSKSLRHRFAEAFLSANAEREEMLKRAGVDFFSFNTGDDFVEGLLRLFKKRSKA